MEFLHCNRCFQRNPTDGYLISSCFHIFCQNCTKSDLTHCQICGKDVRIVRLNGNISQGIKIYFTDPLKSFTEFMEKLQRKMDFQSNLRIHLIKHLTKEKEKKRQMELYFRKKGQEFEAQKKKLAETNSWILTAERKLQQGEEERCRLIRDVEELQNKLRCSFPTQPLPVTPTGTPFSFAMCESDDMGRRSSLMDSSPNSTFNMVSPLVTSPARSMNETNYQNFFSETMIGNGTQLGDDTMFGTVSTLDTHQRTALSDTTAFSTTFNNMFTPSKSMEGTMMDKTSHSLENWRNDRMGTSGGLDLTHHETSLPNSTALLPPAQQHHSRPPQISNSHRNSHHQHLRQTAPHPPGAIRDIRRYSSQPGYLAHRKSMNRSGSSNGSGGASFHEQNGLF